MGSVNEDKNVKVSPFNPVSILNSKATVTAELIKNAVMEGEVDASLAIVTLKKYAKLWDVINKGKDFKEVKEHMMEEVLKYQEGNAKTFTCHGATITAAAGNYADFSQVDCPVLKRLEEYKYQIEEALTARKEYLKARTAEYNAQNKPQDVLENGLTPFTITFESLPNFEWIEGGGEVVTNPVTYKGKATLRFSV